MAVPYDNEGELAVTFLLGEGDPALSPEWSDEDREQLVGKVKAEIWTRVPERIREAWMRGAMRIDPMTVETPAGRATLARRMVRQLNEVVQGYELDITSDAGDGCSYVYTDHVRYCSYTFGLRLTDRARGGGPRTWQVRHQPDGKREQILPLRLCMRWRMPVEE